MRFYIRNSDGLAFDRVGVIQWAESFEQGDRDVARSRIGARIVSTVFLGCDLSLRNDGDPVLWETMVFGGRFNREQRRYGSEAEARAGHVAMVRMVQARTRKAKRAR